jgi:hypothetical protein
MDGLVDAVMCVSCSKKRKSYQSQEGYPEYLQVIDNEGDLRKATPSTCR